MKKIWILCVCFCICLSGCTLAINQSPGVKIVYSDETPNNTMYDKNEECTETVRMILYHQYGPDMVYDTKTISGAAANAIIELVENLEATGEVEEKISDEKVDWDSVYLPNISAESGTTWIEIGEDLYRTSWEYDSICRVEEPLGEGVVLNLTEECASELSDIWYYYPHDYWAGTYENGMLEMSHRYTSDTDVTVVVKKLKFTSKENVIELEITSDMDQKVIVGWESSNGCDHYGTMDSKEVSLKAGEPKKIQLEFEGLNYARPHRYWLEISIGLTKLDIELNVEK